MVSAAVCRTEILPLVPPRAVGEVVRHAPTARRIRLQVSGLLGHPSLAARIEREVRARPGVEWVRADPVSGRVAIGYAPDARVLDQLETHIAPAAPRARRRRLRLRSRRERVGETPAAPAGEPWFALAAEEVLARLGSDRDGLEPEEAARRLARFGHNEVDPVKPRSRLAIIGEQFWNLPSGLLIGSAIASLLLGDLIDAGAILAVTVTNAAIGYQLERHSEDLVGSWRRLEAGVARVLRGGAVAEVPASEVVPGDLLLCRAGDVVPADARVLDGCGLTCDEAPLTGESAPRDKGSAPVPRDAPLAERDSMLHAGTTVASGHGLAAVVATGAATEVARVRALLQGERPPRAPIQERMESLVRRASHLGLAAGGAAALAGLLRRRPLAAITRGAVALGVAAIPEGLPVTATAAQVRAMQRMRRRGVVARRASAAETLGSVTVVCADKTGTLTRNSMELECLALPDRTLRADELHADPRDPLAAGASRALAALVLSSELDLAATGRGGAAPLASATEVALLEAARRAGLEPDALVRSLPRRSLEVRGDGRHYVTSVHEVPGGEPLVFVKGAPEQIVGLCDTCDGAPLDEPARAALLASNRELASGGLRVLGVAWGRRAPDGGRNGLDFLGLAGLRDPTRASAAAAVRGAAGAGIRTIILTGDQRATASAVAGETGVSGEVIDGGELAAALERGDPAAHARLARIAALSRVTPADKLVIVRALRAAGEVVAMAGDGVNDAPALRAADVGVAVGARASDMARRTADVVLESENLRDLLYAVGEGRVVHDNLRRAIRYLVATNLSEVLVALAGAALGRDTLTPLQLLWINLLTDTAPAIGLSLEEGESDPLARRPPGRAELIDRDGWRSAALDGALMAGFGLLNYAAGGAATSFAGLIGAQISYALRCRAPGAPVSRRFIAAFAGAAGLQLASLATRPVSAALNTGGSLALLAFGAGLCAPLLLGRPADEIVFRPPTSPTTDGETP